MGEREGPLGRMIAATVRCVICGARLGGCDCWTKCDCGWSFRKGGSCRNSIHGGPPQPLEVIATHLGRKRRKGDTNA